MQAIQINHLAVMVCGLSILVLGGLWYSPVLFFKAWKNANGFTDEQLKKVNPAITYPIAWVLGVLMSYNMAFFLGAPGTDWQFGLFAGLATGLGFAGFMFAVVGLFEMRSIKYLLVNGGFITVWFTLVGLILGAWR